MKVTITLPAALAGQTIKTLLEDELLLPRKLRHFLRVEKRVTLNGAPVTWQTLTQEGDQLELIIDKSMFPEKAIPFGDQSLVDCLYEDDHLIVVNKPEGLKTHANAPGELALLNHVSAYVGQTCYVVHRLDQETSGAILFAKTPLILPIMNRLLEKRLLSRQYWALVEGSFSQKSLVYRDKIGRDRHDRRKRRVDPKGGLSALTRVTRLKAYRATSLVNCQLETGRTHQIRVHLAHHGHPLIGDPLYHPYPKGRLMLHAHRLSFTHPLTRKLITVMARSETFEQGLRLL